MHDILYISNKVSVFETKISLIRFIFLTGINIRNTSYRPLIKGQYDSLMLICALMFTCAFLRLVVSHCGSLYFSLLYYGLLWLIVLSCCFLKLILSHCGSLRPLRLVLTAGGSFGLIGLLSLLASSCFLWPIVVSYGSLRLIPTHSMALSSSF